MPKIRVLPFLLMWPPDRHDAQVLLPNTIFLRRGVTPSVGLIAHELAHVDQIERMGLPRYWFTYLFLLLKHGYEEHPMEVEAHDYTRNPEQLARARELLTSWGSDSPQWTY